jgi:hypothetical protein
MEQLAGLLRAISAEALGTRLRGIRGEAFTPLIIFKTANVQGECLS